MDLDKLFTVKEYKKTSIEIACSSREETVQIPLKVSTSATTDYDLTGQILWPVALMLSYYLGSNPDNILDKKNALELGAGTGLPGIVAAKYASKVAVTDGNDIVMELLHENVALQPNAEQIHACKLVWGDIHDLTRVMHLMGHVDVVVAADVVQWPAVVEPLWHTVKALLWNSSNPIFILGIVNRASSTYDMAFKLAEDMGFTSRRVSPEEFLPDGVIPACCREYGGRTTEIHLFTLTDRSRPPMMLQTSAENVVLGKSYENTMSLPY